MFLKKQISYFLQILNDKLKKGQKPNFDLLDSIAKSYLNIKWTGTFIDEITDKGYLKIQNKNTYIITRKGYYFIKKQKFQNFFTNYGNIIIIILTLIIIALMLCLDKK